MEDIDMLPATNSTRRKSAIIRHEGKEGKATRLGKGGDIHYYTEEVIGQGATSIVYKGYFEVEHRKAAVKRLESKNYNIYIDELSILRNVYHPNIILYFATKRWEEQGRDLYYIAMELADITLEDCVDSKSEKYKHTSESHLLHYIKGAANGLKYLHSRRIIHRDIKPTNILIQYYVGILGDLNIGGAKLVDFGISKKIQSSTEGTNSLGKGTFDWMCPEALISHTDQQPFRNTTSVDIFSFGLTIYYTFTKGEHAFGSSIWRATNILGDSPNLRLIYNSNKQRDVALFNIVRAMLKREPEERPKINAIVEHPVFWDAGKKLEFLTAVCNLSLKDVSIAQGAVHKRRPPKGDGWMVSQEPKNCGCNWTGDGCMVSA